MDHRKPLRNELRRITHPREVTTIRINGCSGRDEIVPLVAAFVTLYALLVLATSIAGALAGLGPIEAISCALSMVGNIGPAFGAFGPTANYGAIPGALKLWYSFAMIAGRLEIFTMLILVGRLIALCAAPAISSAGYFVRTRKKRGPSAAGLRNTRSVPLRYEEGVTKTL